MAVLESNEILINPKINAERSSCMTRHDEKNKKYVNSLRSKHEVVYGLYGLEDEAVNDGTDPAIMNDSEQPIFCNICNKNTCSWECLDTANYCGRLCTVTGHEKPSKSNYFQTNH